MRRIGHLSSQSSALTFSSFLVRQGITNEVEVEEDNWAIWVHSEDEWDQAKELLGDYRGNPDNPRFHTPLARAVIRKHREARERAHSRGQTSSGDSVSVSVESPGFGPLTLAIAFGAMVMGLVSGWGSNLEMLGPLFMTHLESVGSTVQWQPGLKEILQGEIWRLVTPLFIHFGWMHLLFNLLWFSGLGSLMESKEGTGRLVLLLALLAVVSNLGQYVMEGPNFGGLSGVVYGMVGFVWMKFRFEPQSGYYISFGSMTVLMIWYFLCLLEVIPHAANGAHTFGLLAGFAFGFLAVQWRRWFGARSHQA